MKLGYSAGWNGSLRLVPVQWELQERSTCCAQIPTPIAVGLALQLYRGINILLLWMTAEARGYTSPWWLSYKQASLVGGQVRKGEKATHCVFYKQLGGSTNDDSTATEAGDDSGTNQHRAGRVLRSYAVFNADQIDGLSVTPVVNRYRPKEGKECATNIHNKLQQNGSFFAGRIADFAYALQANDVRYYDI